MVTTINDSLCATAAAGASWVSEAEPGLRCTDSSLAASSFSTIATVGEAIAVARRRLLDSRTFVSSWSPAFDSDAEFGRPQPNTYTSILQAKHSVGVVVCACEHLQQVLSEPPNVDAVDAHFSLNWSARRCQSTAWRG